MGQHQSPIPVYYAVAQVRFSPVQAMAKYVPDIQDQWRRQGFSTFQEIPKHQMTTDGLKGSDARVGLTLSWQMTNQQKNSGFILAPDFLAFHTTTYETSEDIIFHVLEGLKLVDEVVALANWNRLGLRFLNAVIPNHTQAIDDLLAPGLRGLRMDRQPLYRASESFFQTGEDPETFLVARTHRRFGQPGFPPDMQSLTLYIQDAFVGNENSEHLLLDIDHFARVSFDSDLKKAEKIFFNLDVGLKNAFNAAVTDPALKAWCSLSGGTHAHESP